jgi:thiol-disulfide isomerase/thioredoxin
MNKALLVIILVIQAVILGLLTHQVADLKAQSLLLPAQIDLLLAAGDKVINLDCPECPGCPPCKDYTPDFDKLRKQLKSDNSPQGYYYYGGCR